MAKILIVDDNAVNRDLLNTILTHQHHEIHEARDGAEGLELARATHPDLIVTDILMPTMDGYEFVRQLRLDPAIATTPVIFCTADYHGREAQKLANACGVAHILIKPCEPQAVLDTVAAALSPATEKASIAPGEFSRDHLRLLTDKLSQKTMELESVNQRLTALIEISLQLAAEPSPSQLLEKVCRAARTLIGANFCAVAAGAAEADKPDYFFTGGIGDAVASAIGTPPLRQGALGAMLQRRCAWRVADNAGVPVVGLPTGFPTLRGLLAAPICSLRHTYGWLCLGGKVGGGQFTETDERLLMLLGEQVGRIYENVSLLAKVQNNAAALQREATERRVAQDQQAILYEALQQAYEDLRQSQQFVMQQERLRALGQMASGVAHDINNAISPVMLYTDSLLEQERGLSERARSHLKIIQHAMDSVAQTVSRMREFSRPREAERIAMPTDLNRIVEEVVDFTHARWRDQPQQRGVVIDLRLELEPGLPAIAGLENELRDALTNLLFNAVDAMPEGGVLTIRTYRSQSEAGESVNVAVIDSGVGMTEETRRRCLEPFFTTKGEQGTGLGLAMVYGTVQRHGAELHIDSEPGKGSTLRLKFPVGSAPAENAAWLPQRAPLPSLSILVVDDDPVLLESMRDTLESDGHDVTVADGGQRGIDAFFAGSQRGTGFALVITDLGMPYVDGRKVAAAVKAHSSATPVIMLTGWGQRTLSDGDIPHVDRVLSKPPKLADLRRALEELAGSELKARGRARL